MEPDQTSAATREIELPITVSSQSDINRLIRELESLQNEIMQSKIRSNNHSLDNLNFSRQLLSLAEFNELDLDNKLHIDSLVQNLNAIRQKAPVVHISFASEASADFIEKIITWFRKETSPYVLFRIGLQPKIAAGFILRTPNKQFDFSIGKGLLAKKNLLINKISLSEEKSGVKLIPVQNAPQEQS